MVWGVWKRSFYRALARMDHAELAAKTGVEGLHDTVASHIDGFAQNNFDGTKYAGHVTKKLQLSLHGKLL